MACTDHKHRTLRDLILRYAHEGVEVLGEKISSALGGDALENMRGQRHVAINPAIRNPTDSEFAKMMVGDFLARLLAPFGMKMELSEAMEEMHGHVDEGVTWRLAEANKAFEEALKGKSNEQVEFFIAENGAKLDPELLKRSRESFAAINFSKKR